MRPIKPTADSHRGRVLALLCGVYFLVILDAAIVRLTLPSLHHALGLSAASQTWVANAYMLSFGTLLLLGGRLADLIGRKRVPLGGLGVFTLASLACGLAGSAAMLIAARAMQGVGAAAMTPAALSILMSTFPEGAERNKAIGAWGATGGVGATAAWIIGGPLIDGPGWKWVFWINVPVGIAIAALVAGLVRESRDAAATRDFDVAGVLSVTAALVALIYAVIQSPTAGWGSTQTVSLFALSLALFAVFGLIERRAKAPLVPRRLARSRTLLAANLGLACTAASIYGMAFIISLYGQQVLGYSALKFGLAAVILPIGAAVGAGLGQAFVTRRGPRVVSSIGIAGLAVGFVLLARLPVHASYLTDLLPGLVLFGVPLGLAATAYSIATLMGVSSRDAGLASGLNNTFEQVGGALGTAIMATIAATRTGDLLHAGAGQLFALDRGFQLAFAAAIAFPILGLLVSLLLLRRPRPAGAMTALEPAAAAAPVGDERQQPLTAKETPMTTRHTDSAPSTPVHRSTDNWERWWRGLDGRPGEVLWDAHPADLTADLAVLEGAFFPTLPVIDLGCGDGRQTRFLAEHFTTVVGVDLAPSAIARARNHENPLNVSYRVLDVREPTAAGELHAELGDANVYMRGVLQSLPETDRSSAVNAIATLLGRTGTLFLKELAPAVEQYFAALVEHHGAPAGMERIMRLVPPGAVSDAELARLFAPPRFHLLTTGAGHIHTANVAPDGHPILVPARYALVKPAATDHPQQGPPTIRDIDVHADLQGAWKGEVHFTAGPQAGDIHHEAWLFAEDGLLVHLRTRRGIGEWSCEGERFSFAFYEVILNDAGKPHAVVHITASGELAPDRNTFEASGRGDVYGLGGELIASNTTVGRGWRGDHRGM